MSKRKKNDFERVGGGEIINVRVRNQAKKGRK